MMIFTKMLIMILIVRHNMLYFYGLRYRALLAYWY